MDSYASIGFDGVNFLLEANRSDGTVVQARIAMGTHTAQDYTAAVANVRQSYLALRQWAVDAQDAFNTWPNKTAAQKDAAQRETIRRLGVFFDRFADFMLASNTDS